MNPDALLSASDAARYFGTSIAVICMWRSRGHLAIADHDWRGRPRYKLADLLQAERTTRQTRTKGIRGGTVRAVRASIAA